MGAIEDALRRVVHTGDAHRGYLVGFSGGLDSTVLLHALSRCTDKPVRALYVHHGLHPDADHWAQHCDAVCTELGVAHRTVRVDLGDVSGCSLEAAARTARYRALAAALRAGERLLTAHHAGDQAETVLFNLLRGSGPSGLAGMPVDKPFGVGRHVRPLLAIGRPVLKRYAHHHGLNWVEDSGNADQRFDRNMLRHTVLPRLAARFPGMEATLGRVAGLQAEAVELLAALAQQDLQALTAPGEPGLSVSGLRALTPPRAHNVLRCWLRRQGLPLPSQAVLRRITGELLPAADDAMPQVAWADVSVRRFRGRVVPCARRQARDPDLNQPWAGERALLLGDGNGRVVFELRAAGLCFRPQRDWRIRYRCGAERLRPRPDGPTRSLKQLFQEAKVPPWERQCTPLIYCDDRLAAVAGLAIDAQFYGVGTQTSPALWPCWSGPSPLPGCAAAG